MEFLRSLLRRRFSEKPVVATRNFGCFLRLIMTSDSSVIALIIFFVSVRLYANTNDIICHYVFIKNYNVCLNKVLSTVLSFSTSLFATGTGSSRENAGIGFEACNHLQIF